MKATVQREQQLKLQARRAWTRSAAHTIALSNCCAGFACRPMPGSSSSSRTSPSGLRTRGATGGPSDPRGLTDSLGFLPTS
jgi:hypothetical protein